MLIPRHGPPILQPPCEKKTRICGRAEFPRPPPGSRIQALSYRRQSPQQPRHLGFAKESKAVSPLHSATALHALAPPWTAVGSEAPHRFGCFINPATLASRRIQSGVAAALCHRTPCIGAPLDCGGKRSATPLWMFHPPRHLGLTSPLPAAPSPHCGLRCR